MAFFLISLDRHLKFFVGLFKYNYTEHAYECLIFFAPFLALAKTCSGVYVFEVPFK